MPSVTVVLFDIGGVLVDLPGLPGIPAVDEAHQAELWARWIHSPWVAQLESGHCSPQDFAQGMVTDWNLPLTAAEYLAAFAAWPKGLYEQAPAIVAGIRDGVLTGCLSNSNPVHWPRMRDEMGLGSLLDVHFVSYLIGVTKPDRRIYEYAIASLERPAGSVLFLDDNPVNVAAARDAGMLAAHTVGPEAARAELARRGLLA